MTTEELEKMKADAERWCRISAHGLAHRELGDQLAAAVLALVAEVDRLQKEAADRKEYTLSQESELRRVYTTLEQLRDSYTYVCQENDRLLAIGSKPANEVFQPLIENAELQARIRELEAALRGQTPAGSGDSATGDANVTAEDLVKMKADAVLAFVAEMKRYDKSLHDTATQRDVALAENNAMGRSV